MGIEDRLRRLEDSQGCVVCGVGAPGTITVLVGRTADDDVDVDDVEKELCPVCGRRAVTMVRWPEDLLEP